MNVIPKLFVRKMGRIYMVGQTSIASVLAVEETTVIAQETQEHHFTMSSYYSLRCCIVSCRYLNKSATYRNRPVVNNS